MRTEITTKAETVLLTKENAYLAKDFHSGNDFLDTFIKSDDAFNDSLGKTFIWIDESHNTIYGYYNIGVGYIDMYDGNDKYKIGGAIHLNFFAVNEQYRGIVYGSKNGVPQKVSDNLFDDFMERVIYLRNNHVGFSFVTLASTEEGYSLYKRHYFEDLDYDLHFSFKDDEKGCKPMYLALDIE